MISQINVVVHNAMTFNNYLDHQVKKQIHWNILNKTDSTIRSAFSPISTMHRLILNMVIDKYNDANNPYEDISMNEGEVDWD